MKFYGSGIVWDTENNKPLMKFEKGEFETYDKIVISRLMDLGYKSDMPIAVYPDKIEKVVEKKVVKPRVRKKKDGEV